MSRFFTWNEEAEDPGFFSALEELPSSFRSFARPAEVPIDWHKTEDQGPIGSCTGNGLASVLERLAHVRGVKVQLSRIFAFLATQKRDGWLGNSRVGSTVSRACSLAIEDGCPPEELTGYPSQYPSKSQIKRILSPENYAAGAPFKAVSKWRVSRDDHDETLNFLGGGGGILFGIAWRRGMIPHDRIIRQFRPGNSKSGHAMCVLGYDRDGNPRAANSHRDGPYTITVEAWQQMLRHRRTSAVGLLGNSTPEPVDWIKNSPHFD